MSKVVHFEIPAKNPEKLGKFYTKVFDWKIERWGKEPYWLVDAGPKKEMGIGGGIFKKEKMKTTVNTVGVKNIKDAMDKVKKNGGKVMGKPHLISEVGYHVYAKDLEGNIFGMLEPTMMKM